MSTAEAVIKNITNIDEIESFQSQYSYQETLLDKISVEDDYKIRIENDKYEATETAMKNLCNLLRIPFKFGRNIPVDLLQQNVDRLKSPRRVRLVNRGTTIVNVVDIEKEPHFRVLNTAELLQYFQGENFELKKSIIGDEGAIIDIIHRDLGNIELEPGNIVNFGYRLQNPFTMMDNATRAQLFADQLVCKNGMTLPRKLFGVSLNLRKDYGDAADYFDRFKNSLDQKVGRSYSLDSIAEIFRDLSNTKVKGISATSLFTGIKAIDEQTSYKIFEIEGKEKEIEKKKHYNENPLEETNFTFFDVMYKLTEECQKFGLRERIKAEDYTSSIIQLNEKQKLFLN